jgi:hypothetical protein
MPTPLLIPLGVRKIDGRWLRNCPKCGVVISHLRRNYCVNSAILKQICKRCSNINNHPSGMVGPVRVSWFNSFHKSAISRGYYWEITIEDIVSLYEIQKGKCSLTGWDIFWVESGWEHTASIDRINNKEGYTLENIQLVHKIVNMSRGTLSVSEFIDMCNSVAENNSK